MGISVRVGADAREGSEQECSRFCLARLFRGEWVRIVWDMASAIQLKIAAFSGALAVGLGAFGAHGLKGVLESQGTTDVWETAVFYHFVHTLVLLWIGGRGETLLKPWGCFLLGTTVFSGALYVLAVTGVKWLGAVAPIGGGALIVGWLWLGVQIGRSE
ncbi:MAG: hypothetical protein M2R45_01851 [Verrucomicrobia subdivision 3 bacterium]|nr:hypothetical protein [Limisphaerales bacterium]MCS1415651.1 hypothetical protein [Limisphaerales bacterium]